MLEFAHKLATVDALTFINVQRPPENIKFFQRYVMYAEFGKSRLEFGLVKNSIIVFIEYFEGLLRGYGCTLDDFCDLFVDFVLELVHRVVNLEPLLNDIKLCFQVGLFFLDNLQFFFCLVVLALVLLKDIDTVDEFGIAQRVLTRTLLFHVQLPRDCL